jgi:hypothetical protein
MAGAREYRLVVNGGLRYRNASRAVVRAYRDRLMRAYGKAGATLPTFRIYWVRKAPGDAGTPELTGTPF